MLPVISCSIGIMSECALKAREYHRSLIGPRSFQVIGCEADNGRAPVVTIQTHIHTPLLHGLVVDDIRSPLHTLHGIALKLPAIGIEVTESHLLALAILHLLDDVSAVGILEINGFSIHVSKKTVAGTGILFTRIEGVVPYLVVARSIGLGSAQMRTVDIIFRIGGFRYIHHDRRVMHSDAPCYRLGSVCISQIIIADRRLSHSSVHRHQTHDRK